MSHGHFKLKCKNCGTIITQCRCASIEKTIEYGRCNECYSPKQAEEVDAAPRKDAGGEPSDKPGITTPSSATSPPRDQEARMHPVANNLNRLETLVRNLLVENINFQTGYYFRGEYEYTHRFVTGPLRSHAEYIIGELRVVKEMITDYLEQQGGDATSMGKAKKTPYEPIGTEGGGAGTETPPWQRRAAERIVWGDDYPKPYPMPGPDVMDAERIIREESADVEREPTDDYTREEALQVSGTVSTLRELVHAEFEARTQLFEAVALLREWEYMNGGCCHDGPGTGRDCCADARRDAFLARHGGER